MPRLVELEWEGGLRSRFWTLARTGEDRWLQGFLSVVQSMSHARLVSADLDGAPISIPEKMRIESEPQYNSAASVLRSMAEEMRTRLGPQSARPRGVVRCELWFMDTGRRSSGELSVPRCIAALLKFRAFRGENNGLAHLRVDPTSEPIQVLEKLLAEAGPPAFVSEEGAPMIRLTGGRLSLHHPAELPSPPARVEDPPSAPGRTQAPPPTPRAAKGTPLLDRLRGQAHPADSEDPEDAG